MVLQQIRNTLWKHKILILIYILITATYIGIKYYLESQNNEKELKYINYLFPSSLFLVTLVYLVFIKKIGFTGLKNFKLFKLIMKDKILSFVVFIYLVGYPIFYFLNKDDEIFKLVSYGYAGFGVALVLYIANKYSKIDFFKFWEGYKFIIGVVMVAALWPIIKFLNDFINKDDPQKKEKIMKHFNFFYIIPLIFILLVLIDKIYNKKNQKIDKLLGKYTIAVSIVLLCIVSVLSLLTADIFQELYPELALERPFLAYSVVIAIYILFILLKRLLPKYI